MPEEMAKLNAIAEEFATEDPCGNSIEETIDELLEPGHAGQEVMSELLGNIAARLSELHGIAEIVARQSETVLSYLRPHLVGADCFADCEIAPGDVLFGFGLLSFPDVLLTGGPAANDLLKEMRTKKTEGLTWVT